MLCLHIHYFCAILRFVSLSYQTMRIPVHFSNGVCLFVCLFRHYLRTAGWILIKLVDPGGPVVIVLASGSEVRGFDPGRGRWIFSERKNPEYDFFRKGSKAVGPVS